MKMPTRTSRFWLLCGTLLLCGGIINLWEQTGEASVSRRSLRDFPATLGAWQQRGNDIRLDDESEQVLRADDYVSRNYESLGRAASFYVGYYSTQRNGVTYHSPLKCLPGSGWILTKGDRITITTAGGQAFEANRYQIQNGSQTALMIYWYQGRGTVTPSEYWAKYTQSSTACVAVALMELWSGSLFQLEIQT